MIKVIPFKDHLLHKNKVLDLIKKMPDVSIKDHTESLTKTDFYLKPNDTREYWDYFFPHLKNFY